MTPSRGFTSFYTDEYFRQATGSSREECFAKMDERGASKSHAAAVEAIPAESTPTPGRLEGFKNYGRGHAAHPYS